MTLEPPFNFLQSMDSQECRPVDMLHSPVSPSLESGVHLDQYSLGDYGPGAPLWQQLLWYYIGSPVIKSSLLPFSGLKVQILRWFGAKLGQGVRIKPGLQVKFPWRLTVGDHCWLGEQVWIDNIAAVTIGDHVCISQNAYLCTGNHDWSDPHFSLRLGPIVLESESWVAARAIVGPGVTVGQGAILSLGSVALRSLEAMTIYVGNPATPVKKRVIQASEAGEGKQHNQPRRKNEQNGNGQ
ncbi:putative colanic acid biosynthesis acetyltransferase [Candidatus Synechococcus calcipolaris G9]|uniref:Colanic acid biosynthesis acetyltransferase n=1 Tax=Candidatus Synechococcus calcipolaris G9 TaxID=1497997 RepID=A0ABT6EWS8_9SYNE|nr:putative colanic acid biosynthesis acetyltransferase [Candidatus Synechococcus calcipolaris]MDG2990234.1 putative colanic acid biosynthesis acetyltransferase [Candidatus Synechococcus calcipolaris G9]